MKDDKYYPPIIIKVGKNIGRFYSPILTEEERERRMERIKAAAVELVLSVESRKSAKEKQENVT